MDDKLLVILSSYGYDTIKEAFLIMNKERYTAERDRKNEVANRLESGEDGWFLWTEEHDREHGDIKTIITHEWFTINNKTFAREIDTYRPQVPQSNMQSVSKKMQATDLSMQPTNKICPECGGTLAWEPICPGCKLGRLGFKGRFVCMEDMDHEFYVLRDGIILPNQGD